MTTPRMMPGQEPYNDDERRRAEDAHQERTPGPWRVGHYPTTVVVGEGGEGVDRPRIIADVAGDSRRSGEEARANTLFIVEAVNEHDGLTAALEAARARVAELEQTIETGQHLRRGASAEPTRTDEAGQNTPREGRQCKR
jgi:hypothetical protein